MPIQSNFFNVLNEDRNLLGIFLLLLLGWRREKRKKIRSDMNIGNRLLATHL